MEEINCDIKNLSRGSKTYLPVFVEGANLSTGDMHFSQGDGEVSFCGAIEMSGFLELKYLPNILIYFYFSALNTAKKNFIRNFN